MRTLILLVPVILLALPASASAGGFLTPIDSPSMGRSYAILTDGSRVDGELRFWFGLNSRIKNVTLRGDDGVRYRLKASEIRELGNKPDHWNRFVTMVDSSRSLQSSLSTDYAEIATREFVVWKQAPLPGRRSRTALQQLLNPGSDSRIEVFHDPRARRSRTVRGHRLTLSGGQLLGYVAVKDGQQALRLRPLRYRKQFGQLFGDCEEMMSSSEAHKPRFGDFAEHVASYDRLCTQ